MDFKSILNKLDSMEAPEATPKAPTLPAAIRLNEDAELRVLAGTSSILEEAKKMKKEEKVDEAEKTATTWTDSKGNKHPATRVKGDKYTGKEAEKEEKSKEKVDEAEKTDTTWTDMSGKKHPATKVKGGKYTGKEAEAEEKKKEKKEESIDTEQFKSKFAKMVAEAKKKKPDDDGDGVPNWADKKPGKDDNADKKKSGKKGMSAKQAKFFGKKKTVKESYEPRLTFRDMVKLVQESGGQQQIDALDKELFVWAQRVANSKLGEGMKAEVYAGLVYERMGGVFEMYDVLNEDSKKKVTEAFTDDEFEKTYRSWDSPNPAQARADAIARSAEAEQDWSPEEKSTIEKLFNDMRSAYPSSKNFYKSYRGNRKKKDGTQEGFAAIKVDQYHKGDRLSPEADAFDQKIKDLGGSKRVDIFKKTIVWRIPKSQIESTKRP
jgi:hypothetical protein